MLYENLNFYYYYYYVIQMVLENDCCGNRVLIYSLLTSSSTLVLSDQLFEVTLFGKSVVLRHYSLPHNRTHCYVIWRCRDRHIEGLNPYNV